MPTTTPPRARPALAFEIRRSPIQGRGAFATRRIRAGQRLIEYTGERLTPDEGDARYHEDGMARHHTFLFTLDDETVIDGGRGGNESRFINHSCDPNCEAVIEDDRIFIFAKRNIQPGAELTYDYQYERFDYHTAEDERFYACRCGAANCRGSILKGKRGGRGGSGAKGGKAGRGSGDGKGAGEARGANGGKRGGTDGSAARSRNGTAKGAAVGRTRRAVQAR